MKIITKLLFFVSLITLTTNIYALSLKESVQKTIKNNPEIAAELSNQEGYSKYVDERKGDYLPTVDLSLYYEKNRTIQDYSSTSTTTDVRKKGWNGNISIEQILYNGGLTSNQIDEMNANEMQNLHRSKENIESIVINSLNAYLGIVQYNELLALSKDMVQLNDDNLVTAKDKEEISGEVLETFQVSSKLHFAQEKYQEQEDELKKNENNFKKYVGIVSPNLTCRPIIDSSKIPSTLSKTLELAVINSDKILEALAKIKVQQAKLYQANSSFLPTLSLRLESTIDKDLELANNGRENEHLIRLNLNWNIFNGGSDYHVSQREQKFLIEAKKNLDAVTNEVVADVKTAYFKYNNNLKRVNTLKKLKEDNRNIVDIYKQEFDAGTRTFIDILNAQSELYQAETSLVNREYVLFNDYYELLFNLSALSQTILSSKNQTCQAIIPSMKKEIKDDKEEDLGDLSDENEVIIDTPKEVKKDFENKERTEDDSSYLNAPSSSYTINLATFNSIEAANDYVSLENIQDNTFAFSFSENKSKAKVIYGVYENLSKAKEALAKLSETLLKNKPYIDNLGKHQDLYKKYN